MKLTWEKKEMTKRERSIMKWSLFAGWGVGSMITAWIFGVVIFML